MSDLSVLLIGAGGAWGTPLVEEFIEQSLSFKRIAILARDDKHAQKFSKAKERGIDIVSGSFLDASSYEGQPARPRLLGVKRIRLMFGH